jgi:4-hydroxybenzoate polyprenyltransferase
MSGFLVTVRRYLELIRFSHTVFALPFALSASLLAWTVSAERGEEGFRWQDLLGVLVCMAAARSAAMAFNRLADRRIDAANPRTAGRHLPAGLLSGAGVWAFTLFSAAAFFAGALLFLPNWLPVALAAPVLVFLCGYSFAKRFTSLAHVWLGMALALAPVCAWVAIRGEAVLADPRELIPSTLLGCGVLFWVAGFDILYACQDADFDRRSGLHSIPSRFGVAGALRIAAGLHAVCLAFFAALPWSAALGGPALPLGWIYGIGIAATAILLLYQHALVRPDDLSRVNQAFFHVNAVISLGLFALVAIECVRATLLI